MISGVSIEDIIDAFLETLLMNLVTSVFVLVLGLVLGYYLYKLETKSKFWYNVLNITSSILRSIPFIILILLMLPFTNSLFNFLFGSDQRLLFAWQGAVPALVISATPFYARLVHFSYKEVSSGKKEMLESLGASDLFITKVITKEAMPSLISNFTQTVVTLIGFSSVAAIIGAGGLGYLATRERNNIIIVLISTVLILLLVFIAQAIGDFIVKKIDRR